MSTLKVSGVISSLVDKIVAKSPLPVRVEVPRHCHRHLKELTEPIRPNDLVLVGGNDSGALLMSLVLELSIDHKFPSLVLCDEVTLEASVLILLSALSYIPVPDLLARQIPPSFFERFNEASTLIHDAPLRFCPQKPFDLAALDETVHGLKKERKVDVLFIESHVTPETCVALKDLAWKEDIVVVARSSSSDLGALSQLADVGVLAEETSRGSVLDYIDSRKGERETAFCYDQDLTIWQSWQP